ncbi:hypothetical protein NCS52_01461100 [Fusarium sp. LHS14.1]|nr:hypothetical protein NCS52_01461100 [Fusarium sp. LHS14.1]
MTQKTVERPLEGKLAIVTGAFREGIGAAITKNLAAKGAHVLGVYTSESSTKTAQEMIASLSHKHGVKIVAVKADLNSSEAAASHIIKTAKAQFADSNGNLIINILVNNAGVGGDYALGEVPVAEFHRIYAVNVLAPIMVTQAVLPFLPYDRSGRIVNISSVASSMGFKTHTLYGGTKAALEAMTRTWAHFWKQLEPFQLATPLSAVREGVDPPELTKLANEKMAGRRPAYWAEVASIVGMLCGEESAWCTGSIVCANGGLKFGL